MDVRRMLSARFVRRVRLGALMTRYRRGSRDAHFAIDRIIIRPHLESRRQSSASSNFKFSSNVCSAKGRRSASLVNPQSRKDQTRSAVSS